MDAATYPDGYGSSWVDARCHICSARFDSIGSLSDHLEDEHHVPEDADQPTLAAWGDREGWPIR